jgi:hypothetical protein
MHEAGGSSVRHRAAQVNPAGVSAEDVNAALADLTAFLCRECSAKVSAARFPRAASFAARARPVCSCAQCNQQHAPR